MPLAPSAIRFNSEEKEWITAFANMNGNTFSKQVRLWVLERLEDELDARDLKQAIAEDNGERYTLEEIKSELGL